VKVEKTRKLLLRVVMARRVRLIPSLKAAAPESTSCNTTLLTMLFQTGNGSQIYLTKN